jgi:cyanate permease
MPAQRHNDDLFPVCCLMGIFAGFFGFLLFAPMLLPTLLAASVGILIGLLICADGAEQAEEPDPIRHVLR